MMTSTIPFSGFYESIHSYLIQHEIDSIIYDDNGWPIQDLLSELEDSIDDIEFSKVHFLYAKAYTKCFGSLHDIKIKFESLESPRFYNFESDRIFVEISYEEAARIYHETDRGDLESHLKEKFTDRSGFISFYPNSLNLWPCLRDWDHNQLGTLIEAYIGEPNEDFIAEQMSGNGYLSDFIFSSQRQGKLNLLSDKVFAIREKPNAK